MGYPLFCIRKECMDTKTQIDLNLPPLGENYESQFLSI